MRAAGGRPEQFPDGTRVAFRSGSRAGSIDHSRMRGEIDPLLAAQEYEDQLDRAGRQERRENLPTRFDFARAGRRWTYRFTFSGNCGALERKRARRGANYVPEI